MSQYFKNKGFTLIEALVSISIVVVILTVVLIGQARYTDKASLNNAADEIAVTIAQAQAYGLSVKQFYPSSGEFKAGYGLSVYSSDSDTPGNIRSKNYILFADLPNTPVTDPPTYNGQYNGAFTCPTGAGQECITKATLKQGVFFEDVCWIHNNNNESCNNIGRVDLTFLRPEIDTRFEFWNNSLNKINLNNVKGVRLILSSPAGTERSVIIYTTGQISVI